MQPQNYNHDCSDFIPCPIDTCFGCVNGYCTIVSGDAETAAFTKTEPKDSDRFGIIFISLSHRSVSICSTDMQIPMRSLA